MALQVRDAINHIGVTFGILDVDKYELKCVQFGRLIPSQTLGSYFFEPRTEVYFTRKNITEGVRNARESRSLCEIYVLPQTKEVLNYTLIRPPTVIVNEKIPKPKVPKRKAQNLTIWDVDVVSVLGTPRLLATRSLTTTTHTERGSAAVDNDGSRGVCID